MKYCLILIAIAVLPISVAAEQSPRDQYLEAFTEVSSSALVPRLIAALQQQGMTEELARQKAQRFVDATIECHMLAMDMNAPEITRAAYDAVASGGSYADAKMAFELSLGDALQSGDPDIVESFTAATEAAQACVQNAQSELAN